MTTTKHPITGVELNMIDKKRHTFDEDVKKTMIILRKEGRYFYEIAQMLGTSPYRLRQFLRSQAHKKAAEEALRLLKAS